MKTKEERNSLKKEVETRNKKLSERTEEGLAQVTGGVIPLPFNGEPDREPGVPEIVLQYEVLH